MSDYFQTWNNESKWDFTQYDVIPIKDSYSRILNLFKISINDYLKDSKIYAYFLYAIIYANQFSLYSISSKIKTDYYLKYIKETYKNKQIDLDKIQNEANYALNRFLCYSTILNNIFEIPWYEKNFLNLREKIPTLSKLTKDQENKIKEFITDPIIYGKWTSNFPNDLKVIFCASVKNTFSPGVCWNSNNEIVTYDIKNFPFPEEINNEGKGLPDCVRSISLYNQFISDRNLGVEIITNTYWGMIDNVISETIGVNKSYTLPAAEWVKDKHNEKDRIVDNGMKFYDELKNDLRNIGSSIFNIPSNISSGFEDIKKAMMYGSIGIMGLIGLKLLLLDD